MSPEDFLLDYLAESAGFRLASWHLSDSELLARINELGYDFKTLQDAYERLMILENFVLTKHER